jgi:glycine/D-amino acid oxidase-like deaminating enzyme
MKNEKLGLLPPQAGEVKNVVVIGGGASGALTAFELSRAGHSVTLVEAKTLGSGSSSRSAACIRQQFTTPSTVRGMIFCVNYFKRWKEVVGEGKVSPITQNGYLFLKGWDQDLESVRKLVAMQQEAGLHDVELLKPDDIEERFPYLDTTGVKFATWCPSDGFLSPGNVYQDSAEAARSFGATIIQNDAVVSAEHDGNGNIARVILKSGKHLEADIFVNVAGAWSSQVSECIGGSPLQISPRKRYLYFAELKSEGRTISKEHFDALPMIISPYGSYIRRESLGTPGLMLGKLHHADPVTASHDVQDLIEPSMGINNLNDYGLSVHKEMGQFFLDVQDSSLKHTTSGLYADTPDHNPILSYDSGVKNLIHANGFSGHGLMHTPFTAQIVTQMVDAGSDIDEVLLPEDFGTADVTPYRLERDYSSRESLVI